MLYWTKLLVLFTLIDYVVSATATTTDEPNDVTFVDFLARPNSVRHHTNPYQTGGRFLVLRRGETFEFNIVMGRPFNETTDRVRLEFAYGNYPTRDDKSLVHVPLVTVNRRANLSQPVELATDRWDARIVKVDGRQIDVQVFMPPNIPVGTWRLQISTKLASQDPLLRFAIKDTFHVIFNAWNKDDDVYMSEENLRREYVLNEVGKIYVGTYAMPQGRKWVYGQFDLTVLTTVLHLLDRTKLTVSDRADVVRVSRAVSAIVNSHDEGGLLVGNWSGNYMDGLSPWQWTGSAAIFKKFVQNGYSSVKFGQCWVFGGSTTATLRALGIPARTISNFNSAHDTDSSLTVDKFYNGNGGSEIENVNGDSIWNFHVWSEAWMRRRDLPEGFDGWQAIDATPQERSMGAYQLGPASLEAVKQGKTDWAYDVGFVFSEVNADIVYWRPERYSRLQWLKYRTQIGHIGRKILTKMVGKFDDYSRTQIYDAEDIVTQYKFPTGSAEWKKAHEEASRAFGIEPLH